MIFDEYSRYYDLLYAEKDYPAEARYVLDRLRRRSPGVSRIVEFGSGTGRHGRLLADAGCSVVGLERSRTMVEAANLEGEYVRGEGRFRCGEGDVRETRVPGEFDAVISLFHVVSYQTSNGDVQAMFANAARHLPSGGLFLFDVWHAPAVLTQRPEVRIKRVENDAVHLTRLAEPVLHADRNCVEVNYTLFVRDQRDGSTRTLSESHLMRYYSTPEIELLADGHGCDVVLCEEWLTGRSAGVDTWGVCYLLEKRTDGKARTLI